MNVLKLSMCLSVMLVVVMSSSIVRAGLAPDFVLVDVDGEVFRLSGFRGRVVVLDFFGTVCSVCRQEMPELKVVWSQFGSKIVIMSISMWDKDTDEVLRKFRADYGISWILARDTADVYESYGSPGVPALFMVDRDGNIGYKHSGWLSASALIDETNKLMSANITLTVTTIPELSGVHFKVDDTSHYTSDGSFTAELSPGTHQIGLVDTVVKQGEDVEYRFDGWNGTSQANPVKLDVSASSTLRADFSKYYKVVFVQSGGEGALQVTVDGTSVPLPNALWFESGSQHSFNYQPSNDDAGTRFIPASTSHQSPITINNPATITATYKTQYCLTVNTDPAGLSPQPTAAPPSSWHDAGTSVTCVAYEVDKCRFNSWILDGSSQEAERTQLTVKMDKPHEATAQYTAFGDLNFDGKVDEVDMLIIVASFQSKLGDIEYHPRMDFDSNGLISIIDVSVIARDFREA